MRTVLVVFALMAGLAIGAPPVVEGQINAARLRASEEDRAMFEAVIAATRRGNTRLAAQIVEEALGNGSSLAMVLAGLALTDQGDYAQAMNYFRQADAKSDPNAAWAIGTTYLEGRGVAADSNVAFGWLFKAAVDDVLEAQVKVASFYFTGAAGELRVENYEAGMYWAGRAAHAGDTTGAALVRVAETYLSQQCAEARRSVLGQPPDVARTLIERFCFDWTMAEMARPTTAADCELRYGSATLRERFRMVKGAVERLVPCAYNEAMAGYLLAGAGTPSYDTFWYMLVSGLGGRVRAQEILASMYDEGRYVTQSTVVANFWWGTAAQMGSTRAIQECAARHIGYASSQYGLTDASLRRLGYRR